MLNFQLKFLENILHQTTISNSLTGLAKTSVNNRCVFAENLTPVQKFKLFTTLGTCKNAMVVPVETFFAGRVTACTVSTILQLHAYIDNPRNF